MSYPTDVNKKWNRVDLKGGIFKIILEISYIKFFFTIFIKKLHYKTLIKIIQKFLHLKIHFYY